jgi:hypothetical protein
MNCQLGTGLRYNFSAGIDPSLVPNELRAHILPAVRKVFLEPLRNPQKCLLPTTTSPVAEQQAQAGTGVPSAPPLECNEARLRSQRNEWRSRAQMHAAATLGLVGLARLARDHALRMQSERDQMQRRYLELKRQCQIMYV